MKSLPVVALLTGVAVSFAAQASDLPSKKAPPAIVPVQTTSWDGPYAGAQIGRTAGEYEYSSRETADTTMFGAFAGYNVALTSEMLVGGEVAYSMGSGRDNALDADEPMDLSEFDAKLRLGYTNANLLVYGFVGYSSVTDKHDDADDAESGTFRGINFGAGASYLVSSNVFVGAEYIHRNLPEVNDNYGFDTDYSSNTFTFRIGYKF